MNQGHLPGADCLFLQFQLSPELRQRPIAELRCLLQVAFTLCDLNLIVHVLDILTQL